MQLRILHLLFIAYLFLGVQTTNTLEAHPVHVSVVNMDINDDGRIIFSVKLFVDDFQKVINKKYNTSIVFKDELEKREYENYVKSYIFENLRVSAGVALNVEDYSITKMTLNEQAIWFYFEIDNKSHNFEFVSIRNTLMTDLYKDQTNLFIISRRGEDQAYSFSSSDTEKRFSFK